MFVFGASGHSKVVLDLLDDSTVDFIVDDNPSVDNLFGIPVFKMEDNIDLLDRSCVIAVGNNEFRKKIAKRLKCNFEIKIHRRATVSRYARIEEGTVVMAGAVVNSDAVIGKHCIVNSSAVIEHDCVIGNFVHICPNASLAGNVNIGEGSHIGIGATVIQGITIGKWAIIGAGTVVLQDVPDYAVVVGNPGKVIKFNHRNE